LVAADEVEEKKERDAEQRRLGAEREKGGKS
jgi:hypothetical protein